ncbi:hypothetical protein WA026_006159 [Henosepilachna vigintioctopunctata]|uniref:Receptor L-domain domain-containing protein n=1 Tax=Henosepilachna vigintioctopunctata TaxID=420089 RepID=A0AAW1TQM8_9CUCU
MNAKVCSTIDIRNEPSQLNNLQGCRIVNGILYFVLMDNFTYLDFDGFSFPNLIEVTEYVVLFRVIGLTTLRTLFPNLAFIGGKKLLTKEKYSAALTIFDMPDLTEVRCKCRKI